MENRTRIKLTKLGERSDSILPNGYPIGTTKVGYLISKVQVGRQFLMTTEGYFGGFITSPVTEIIDEQTFKTVNSICKIEVIEE